MIPCFSGFFFFFALKKKSEEFIFREVSQKFISPAMVHILQQQQKKNTDQGMFHDYS